MQKFPELTLELNIGISGEDLRAESKRFEEKALTY